MEWLAERVGALIPLSSLRLRYLFLYSIPPLPTPSYPVSLPLLMRNVLGFIPNDFFLESPVLSIEYIHKRAKLFRIELSLIAVAVLAVIFFIWQILNVLRIFK